LHRGIDRLDALVPRSNGLTERSLEALIGFDQFCVLIRPSGLAGPVLRVLRSVG
jgi:hypothetical protein